MKATAGSLKQDILKLYNEINRGMFSAGVNRTKVDFIGNKIIILSINHRVPVLSLLDGRDRDTTRKMDNLLGEHFKAEIKKTFEDMFQLNIVAILKDYDIETEYSGTIVILDRDVESYLNDML
ncbi:Na-translocating system protein MpsC family protein [Paenibacillus aurantius]|uniref:Na-translocating system protein MpsC family protein n=1 Tax=Paenibacillus aurantius TaxID=2918900 RepID=A0AA96RJC3_9BACL|nr:Na-translocating system protein MpsC family protein [Paenibacillus aurantius]WNQ13094.1 Na-translocating system protein MpsC family protein [Paenibacillus aurantius]